MTRPEQQSGGQVALTPKQAQMLRDLSHGGGFDALDPADYHASGSLWFRNRDRVIEALERKGLIDGEYLTDAGRAAIAKAGAA